VSRFQLAIFNYQLKFRQPAGTSRGVYTTRNAWYVLLSSEEYPDKWGIGECAPLPGLSCDDIPEYEDILRSICRQTEENGGIDAAFLRPYPSILFGLETAFRQYETGSFRLWDTPFSRGEEGIPINGLIWMGDYRNMAEQIERKLKDGFRCIKLKIGAIHFDEELALLQSIRSRFPAKEITLRVDANGAFSPGEALDKLQQLADLNIHSIEQPVRAGQWDVLARLVAETPIPIALDEELIGWNRREDKCRLLETIRPQYIILKPSLHGGINGCREWIDEAERLHIGWWITSALESNIGLNAIAQWTATVLPHSPVESFQGLGTGGLFTNNINMPLEVKGDCLWFDTSSPLPPSEGSGGWFSEWFSPSPYITVQTSGSTGMPKRLTVRKAQMIESARTTCSFLHLKRGDKALLCMDTKYIGAKMMLVRTWVAGLDLIVREPSGHPLKDVDTPIDFAAMVPLQVYNSLQVPEEKERLKQVKKLLIGGGSIDPALESELKSFPNELYSTYGMTETLSHIALRRINGNEASPYYTPFEPVRLTLTDNARLVIEAPWIDDGPLYTNDIAELLPDGRFRILGRTDNYIHSGGIKLQIERLEEKIHPIIHTPFAITSAPHHKFGEIVVLLIEKTTDIDIISKQINKIYPAYERPKIIRQVDLIPMTENGKTDRKACKELAFYFR
jgi:o-succinylbenzoate synthase